LNLKCLKQLRFRKSMLSWKIRLEGELVEQIKYSLNNELVSSDIVGTSQPVYDSNATIVSKDGKTLSYTFGTITNMGTK
jgi:GTP-sensing pleiotropic transcriptional regulator CodY